MDAVEIGKIVAGVVSSMVAGGGIWRAASRARIANEWRDIALARAERIGDLEKRIAELEKTCSALKTRCDDLTTQNESLARLNLYYQERIAEFEKRIDDKQRTDRAATS